MFALFKKLFCGSPAREQRIISDPILGELRNDGTGWQADVSLDGRVIGFHLHGKTSEDPNPELLEQARSIVQNFPTFQDKINRFLIAECIGDPVYDGEVRQLKIESISFVQIKKSIGAEIGFSGPDDYRVWHCGYQDGEPRDLGFDD